MVQIPKRFILPRPYTCGVDVTKMILQKMGGAGGGLLGGSNRWKQMDIVAKDSAGPTPTKEQKEEMANHLLCSCS
jgi:hypothetical protein